MVFGSIFVQKIAEIPSTARRFGGARKHGFRSLARCMADNVDQGVESTRGAGRASAFTTQKRT